MDTTKGLIVAVALSVVLVDCGGAPLSHAQGAAVDLPPAIIEFIQRRTGCQDWASKTTFPGQFASAMEALKCSDIARDEQELRVRYASDPKVLSALDATWIRRVERVPVTPQ